MQSESGFEFLMKYSLRYKGLQTCFWQSKIPEHGSVDVHSTLT